jgi:hypothetical protein
MLFLGAGASRAVDLPTLCGLTKLIRETYSDPFKEVERILNQNSDTISYPVEELDLEIFLTILDSMVDPPKVIYELGPLAVYLYKLIQRKNSIDWIVKSEKEIRDLKNNSVQLMDEVLRHPDRNKAKELYDELLSMSANIKNAAGQNTHNIFDHVATTNYDLVLESYARGTDRRFYLTNRGFKQIPGETNQYLELDSLLFQKNVYYLKLHGSLDWWARDDGRIVIGEWWQTGLWRKIYRAYNDLPCIRKIYLARTVLLSIYSI